MTKKLALFSVIMSLITALFTVGVVGNPVNADKPDKPPGQEKKNGDNDYPTTIYLQDIDSHLTSPTGKFRWLDVANQSYSLSYINSYDYTHASVKVSYAPSGEALEGLLTANNMKPNFAYQVKLSGYPESYPIANENIGLAGRWWQEVWDGSKWTGGNLNSKGDGISPNPNDSIYYSMKDDPNYRYLGYMVFDYFITDSKGNASLKFRVDSSYHVLWKTSQRPATASDGTVKQITFSINPKKSAAYDTRYPRTTVSIFGEWERLPVGGIDLAPGYYNCDFFLTEESFHGSGGTYAGNWAAAMGAPIQFEITRGS